MAEKKKVLVFCRKGDNFARSIEGLLLCVADRRVPLCSSLDDFDLIFVYPLTPDTLTGLTKYGGIHFDVIFFDIFPVYQSSKAKSDAQIFLGSLTDDQRKHLLCPSLSSMFIDFAHLFDLREGQWLNVRWPIPAQVRKVLEIMNAA
jgi:hypothetical protein